MSRIVVVGSINRDLVIPVPRLPVVGETLAGKDLSALGGGKGANQAVACSRLRAQVHLIGAVGDDAFGTAMLEELQRDKVSCRGAKIVRGISTGVAVVAVMPGGDNAILVSPGANGHLTADRVVDGAKLFQGASCALFQLEIPTEAVLEGMRQAKRAGALVILDPAPARALPDAVWPLVDVLSPNTVELAALSGRDDPDEAAAKLLRWGVRSVVAHLGPLGAILYRTGQPPRSFQAYRVEAVDSTGAGDAFAAGLAVALGEGRDLEDAVPFACAAGALACTVLGAQPSLPQRQAVEALVARQVDPWRR